MVSTIKREKMIKEIELMRIQMIEIANMKGYSSLESIQKSRELDKLLNKFRKLYC